ncbi:5-carboxymethyl-2-hydroxymuconate Delta-isomerase [Luteimonas sp. 3794]|uniref:5-carboxymethyl-2-hydroxymuconate Delta-isomerase n=1 Tax=Luteimonas sp. 3794 TaxID=2817730 RepID=UPI0028568E32|nr:5-carboxymethyl-2-hydroxymuconate Delta-isomerase [Luteimonas sp. 3794]MDR6992544.1 5-carboxymethyl-2-hydroxymuconate isomerase [Luteimonas sp. 3794]
MPHLILHHTSNLDGFDADAALAAVNRVLVDSCHFEDVAIKSRALALDHYRIGSANDGHGFVHATLKIMPGRSEDVRAALGRAVHDALAPCLPRLDLDCQLCVEVVELQAATYIKSTHARSVVPETHA